MTLCYICKPWGKYHCYASEIFYHDCIDDYSRGLATVSVSRMEINSHMHHVIIAADVPLPAYLINLLLQKIINWRSRKKWYVYKLSHAIQFQYKRRVPTLQSSFYSMSSTVIVSIFALAISYIILQAILHGTQSTEEPRLLESKIPFLDPALGILRNRANYFAKLRYSQSLIGQDSGP